MNLRDWMEMGVVAITAFFAFLTLRFSNHALQGKVDLLAATQKLSESFDEKFDLLSLELGKLRIELDRESLSARALAIDQRLRQSERDHHWTRNMLDAILFATVSEEKRDALINKVNKYIDSRWERTG